MLKQVHLAGAQIEWMSIFSGSAQIPAPQLAIDGPIPAAHTAYSRRIRRLSSEEVVQHLFYAQRAKSFWSRTIREGRCGAMRCKKPLFRPTSSLLSSAFSVSVISFFTSPSSGLGALGSEISSQKLWPRYRRPPSPLSRALPMSYGANEPGCINRRKSKGA
ncbi:hypothetical protein N7468_005680 [Penicillium chermesinum]|uniref:Uncharacterized protein n=1 Tax=Penicillium chermesinum TaxID=63820 RepID=A0A9W9NZR8_9EURO|nr:uncharacterized protein N7468_005680 [Penicillium chermesinum]KAJ5232724.1 hypothetical protein N7468_005680 [Penicillium chermesinum]